MKTTYFLLLLLVINAPSFAQTGRDSRSFLQELNAGWMFRQYNIGEWRTALVPGTVHTDLMGHRMIGDPFYRNNEQQVQWVDKVNWEYQVAFQPESDLLECQSQQLTFHGLDTYTDIFLNGEQIGSTDNMFRTWKMDVKGKLKPGENTLNIRFYSPITRGLEEMEKYGLALPASNDYSQQGGMGNVRVSVYTRKAPYHYGWDWGPRIVPSGIWRPVVLEGWNEFRVDDIFIRQPSVTPALAQLNAEITFLANRDDKIGIEVVHNQKVLARTDIHASTGVNQVSIPFQIKKPRLWWSNGLGEAALYTFEVRVKKGDRIVAQKELSTGIRSLKLIRKEEGKGETFYFELNGVPVFAKGANIIPNDVFLPRFTARDYEKMIRDVASANMNMLRVWGGGIYEEDCFYELCDKHGIMVWQDFMFACAMYPGNSEFLDNVKAEAIDNITRLRNHPCIALWCGNNEIDVAWARWGWQGGYDKADQKRISDAYIALTHQLLPELVEAYTDGNDYWPSSPMSGTEVGAHELRPATRGDNHYWGVWFEKHRFHQFEENIGRFISEYGFQSFPELSTMAKFALPEDYDISSEVMMGHQRSFIGNRSIREYMEWYYQVPEDFEQFIYMSQVLQAKAMQAAFHAHRRHMPYCMGSLLWQLNDCWPAASWSITDYYRNPKAAYYAVREACKPVMLAPKLTTDSLELWVINDLMTEKKGHYSLEIKTFDGKTLYKTSEPYKADKNRSTKINALPIPSLLQGKSETEVFAVVSLLAGKQLLDEQTLYFTQFKHLKLPESPRISLTLSEENGHQYLHVSTDKLACDVLFYLPGGTLWLENNYMDLLPGREYKIKILSKIEDGSTIKARHI